jgi:hypothetical protein
MVDEAGVPTPVEELLTQLQKDISNYEQETVVTDLAAYVTARFSEASSRRMAEGIDDQIEAGLRAVRKEPSPRERELLAESGETAEDTIYSSVTDTKIRGGRSWLLDILANAKDRPFTIEPTPLPELPPAAEDAIVDRLEKDILAQLGPDVTDIPPDVEERAARLKSEALKRAQELAKAAAKRIDLRVQDRIAQSGWHKAFEEFSTDIMMYPAAIIKGPYLAVTRRLAWVDGQLKAVAKPEYKISRVSPKDFYPGPNKAYVIEIARMSAADLQDVKKGIDGVDPLAVDKLLTDFPLGSVNTTLGENPTTLSASVAPDAQFEVMIYTGRLSTELLAQANIPVEPNEHPEVEVWVCNNIVLRALRNPNLLGRRPYHVASFAPIPGSDWGRSLPDILSDIQRVCNAVMRAMVRNLAFSAGPIGEYDANRLEGEKDVADIEPGRMYGTRNDPLVPNRSPALRFQVIPSTAQAMLSVHAAFLKLADDVSGIPAYALGNPQTAGAGRTLGGLSLLMGNAAKGLKAVIGHIDTNVIEPMVTDIYMGLMTERGVPDEDKVDVQVVARGSQGLLQRELSRGNAIDVLQLAVPLLPSEVVTKEGIQYLMREIVAGFGFDPDKFATDPERVNQLRTAALDGTEGLGVTPASAQMGTPPPVLDGRSATPPDPAAAISPSGNVG